MVCSVLRVHFSNDHLKPFKKIKLAMISLFFKKIIKSKVVKVDAWLTADALVNNKNKIKMKESAKSRSPLQEQRHPRRSMVKLQKPNETVSEERTYEKLFFCGKWEEKNGKTIFRVGSSFSVAFSRRTKQRSTEKTLGQFKDYNITTRLRSFIDDASRGVRSLETVVRSFRLSSKFGQRERKRKLCR